MAKGLLAAVECDAMIGKTLNIGCNFEISIKDLAYKINKSDTGILTYYDLKLEPEQASVLPRELNLNEDIIRYLLVKGEK